ncbi:von Willebrand factor A domain-containing protein 5A [Tritrichomonas musculus]|uniref:von Willebrand factor A domain-containing protein 5A n=1 Tax=Tritrichomonas musculus TaxID=1915356 RepID=A0ABR2GX97_9EUKA
MSFGSCCILEKSDFYKMKPKKVEINGFQKGLIMNLEVTQTFQNKSEKNVEISYIFPNDMKICIYGITFVLGNKIINPIIRERKEAIEIYNKSINRGNCAFYGSNIADGLTEFKIGNLNPQIECKIIIKMALKAVITDRRTFFIKFPLDVYTPSGSVDCLNVYSNFFMEIQADKDKISNVKSNVKNAQFDKKQKIFKIANKIQNKIKNQSIMMTFETIEEIESSLLLSPRDKDSSYDYCAVSIVPKLCGYNDATHIEKEFVFLIDCSGSMSGDSIKNASECLELFLRSLQANTYFNIVLFGSTYKTLFKKPKKYCQKYAQKAIELAQNLKANLDGTDIYAPLKYVLNSPTICGLRKVFILTDGEVDNAQEVVDLVSKHSSQNICNTIGLGRFCDGGLLENIATVSGGKCDFVLDNKSISEKVIPQLQASFQERLKNISIHTEGFFNSSFEISPFPIKSICANDGTVVCLRGKKKNRKENRFEDGILITGDFKQEEIEIPVTDIEQLTIHEEDNYGCSKGKNIGKAITALFAFEQLKRYASNSISDKEKKKAIDISISSGVLCQYTGYIGIIEQSIMAKMRYEQIMDIRRGFCCECRPNVQPFVDKYAFSDEDSEDLPQDEDDDDEENENEDLDKDDVDNNDFDMMSLIKYQNIEGYWENLDEVNQIAGLQINKIKRIRVKKSFQENLCIATIIAIALLHVLAPNRRKSWKIIEEKGIDWLKKAVENEDIPEIINEIEKMIPRK